MKWIAIKNSSTRYVHLYDGYICRHHLHETSFRKQLKQAVISANITKRVNAHTFRHTFATQLLMNGCDIRTVQAQLGHSDVRTTQIYTHILQQGANGVISPFSKL